MRSRDAAWIAYEAGATLVRDSDGAEGPSGVSVDSRDVGSAGRPSAGDGASAATGPGLFVGLPGARADGGAFAPEVLRAGAWGVLVRPEHATAALGVARGAVLVHDDPAAALAALATAWRRHLRATVVGITGSVGKTSTKDLLRAIVAPHRRTVATAGNYNTEIGLPLTVLGAPEDTEVLILEMAMRGAGQIAELAAIAEPDVGVITNIAPVHVELLGSLRAIADAKAELLYGLRPGGTAILPADEPLLRSHRPAGVTVVLVDPAEDPPPGLRLAGDVPLTVRRNLPVAVAAARAVGVAPTGTVTPTISAMRGQRLYLPRDVVVIVDCYNANPMSTTAALDDLQTAAGGRRVAVLGDMLELGPDGLRHHAEVGAHARSVGVELLVAVGPLSRHTGTGFGRDVQWVPDAEAAAALVPRLVEPGDTVLLKASRGVGLERVADALAAGTPGC